MVTVSIIMVVVVFVCAGLICRFGNRTGFSAGVTVTLALWGAPFVLLPSYANALFVICGLIGSIVFGLLGVCAWWRLRRGDAQRAWFWLVGGAFAAAPAVALGSYWLTLFLASAAFTGSAQDPSEASGLVRQLGQFPAAMDPRIQSNSGQPMPAEQRRETIYVRLRALADAAVPALQRGLTDADVQVRRKCGALPRF
jgi:hypothetical protein